MQTTIFVLTASYKLSWPNFFDQPRNINQEAYETKDEDFELQATVDEILQFHFPFMKQLVSF